MQVTQLIDVLSRATAAHAREAQTFERLTEQAHDFLESAFGQKYHEGALDAYRTMLTTLRRVLENDEPLETAFATAHQSPDEQPEDDAADWQQSDLPCIA